MIDGRSGSGKTTFAARVAAGLGADQLHLEDLYPGWDGLAAGSRSVAEALRLGGYRRYDWLAGAFAERRTLDTTRPLVIEGCGAVTGRNLRAARDGAGADALVWSIWMESPEPLRRARALGRDGEVFAPHWERWAAQETEHLLREHPLALVDEVRHNR